MFSAKLTPIAPTKINNGDNNSSFWRRQIQATTPIAFAVPSTSSFNASGVNSISLSSPLQPRGQGTAAVPGLNPNAWRDITPTNSTSRRSAHNSRSSTNPYQTFGASGRKKLHRLRQRVSRMAEDDNGLIPAFILNNISSSKKAVRLLFDAFQRKAEKVKQDAMPRALYRGPNLTWMEIRDCYRKAGREEGKKVDDDRAESGVSNISEILQQTYQRSYHVPQVVMPSVHKSDGEINDGDTDPGTDTDVEGDTDVEEGNKENVSPSESNETMLPHAPSPGHPGAPIVSSTVQVSEPANPIHNHDSSHRATVIEIDDQEQLPTTAYAQPPSASDNILSAPREAAFLGQNQFFATQEIDGRTPTNLDINGPSGMASQTAWNAAQSGPPVAEPSFATFLNRNLEQRRGMEPTFTNNPQLLSAERSQPSFAADRAIPQPFHAVFPPAFPNEPAIQQQNPQFALPTSDARPAMQHPRFSHLDNNAAQLHHSQPSYPATSIPPTPQQQNPFPHTTPLNSSSQGSFAQPVHAPLNPFQSVEAQNRIPQPSTDFLQTNNAPWFPSLQATFAFLNATVPPCPPTTSRRIIRRLPVLAEDGPPNCPILFGPHGIQAFLKEKLMPRWEQAPPPVPSEKSADDSWRESRKRRFEEIEEKAWRRPGPLAFRKLAPPPKKSYSGKPPKGSEEDLIRRLELEKRNSNRKCKKRVRFVLQDEPPRKKRRTETTECEAMRLSQPSSPKKAEPNTSQTDIEAGPAMPGAYDLSSDLEWHAVKATKQRWCPKSVLVPIGTFKRACAQRGEAHSRQSHRGAV